MYGERCIGSIYRHGIKGQKWGVRRSPDQLDHTKPKVVDKSSDSSILKDGYYVSEEKGISIHENKLNKFCLKPETKHSKDFFDVGYTEKDGERLFQDLADGFDLSKAIDSKCDEVTSYDTISIPMKLGIKESRTFRTVWRNDGIDDTYRFITAYVDRKLKEDD